MSGNCEVSMRIEQREGQSVMVITYEGCGYVELLATDAAVCTEEAGELA